MKKDKDNRIYIKDEYNIFAAIILGVCLFVTIIIGRSIKDKISFETGICSDCSVGIKFFDQFFEILNNPVPTIVFLIIWLGLFAIVNTIVLSFFHIDSLEKNKK